ncbi:MAG: beta-galactosidase [Thermoflexibacter sp.]|jgi:hypothetical protein|nr:beta-galactosidase [Thermoflexibacter sp.]
MKTILFHTFFCCIYFLLGFVFIFQSNAQKIGEIKNHFGRPTIFVNGQPQVPAFYALTHATGGRWSWEEVPARNLKNFADIGFRLFQVDLYFEDIWYKNSDTLDIDKAQRQVRGVLAQCPDANVVIRIHVNAPFWWNEANKDECTQFADGEVDESLKAGPPFHNEEYDINRSLRASLASEKWKVEAGQKLVEFCKKLSKTAEGKSVVGMHVSGGIYGEWHYWGFIKHDPDTGKAMIQYFRNWLKNKYKTNENLQKAWKSNAFSFENVTVPNVEERLKTQDGIFKDPAQEQRVIDYFTAQQQVVADDAIYFCKIVKENWGRPLFTGIFYGYLHMTFNRQTVGGHLFIKEILESPYIDYLAAPQTYWEKSRKIGGSGNSRGIIESTLLHGKLWLDEIDNGYLHPDTSTDNIRYKERYNPEYEAVIRRSALLPYLRGIGFWYYDFGLQKGFGWWDNAKYLANMKAERDLFMQRLSVPYRSEADVLYVWSQDAFYYMKSAWSPISMNILDHSAEQALRSGAVGDHVYDLDLEKVNIDQYKAVIFMNVFKLTENQKNFIKKNIAKNNRTLIWNYLTGYTDGKSLNPAFVEQLTDFKINRITSPNKPTVKFANPEVSYSLDAELNPLFEIVDSKAQTLAQIPATKQVVVAKKELKNYKSVLCTLPLNEFAVFRTIFEQAGCHIYNSQDNFVYANSGLLLVHSAVAGEKKIVLKNGKILNINIERAGNILINTDTGEVLMK